VAGQAPVCTLITTEPSAAEKRWHMDAPDPDPQVPLSLLLELPPELLDEIAKRSSSLGALLQANRQLSEDISIQWTDYLKHVASELDVSNLPDIPDDAILIGTDADMDIINTVFAWMVAADEFTTQWDGVDLGSLGDYTGYIQELAAYIQANIKAGLDKVAVKFMAAAQDNWTNPYEPNWANVDQAAQAAYTRIMQRYWD
jgi:hypothetical protein